MIEPNSILWKFETQWFYQDHVGEISRKRGQELPDVLLWHLFGWECSGSTQEVWLYLWDTLHWLEDSSWTDVAVCGIPVATESQDLGHESSGKLVRKAKLSMN